MTIHKLSGGLEPLSQWFNENKAHARVVSIRSAT